jgi:hypothetical protein
MAMVSIFTVMSDNFKVLSKKETNNTYADHNINLQHGQSCEQ